MRGVPPSTAVAAVAAALRLTHGPESLRLALKLCELAVLPCPQPWFRRLPNVFSKSAENHSLRATDSPHARAALAALAECWFMLGPEIHAVARSLGEGHWRSIIAPLVQDPRPIVRVRTVNFIRDVGDPELLRFLPELLSDPDRSVSDAAEAALVGLCQASPRPSELRPMAIPAATNAASQLDIAEALLAALTDYPRHQRRGVLDCVLAFVDDQVRSADPTSPLASWLGRGQDPAHAALRGHLRAGRDGLVRQRAFEWLTIDAVAAASLDRLARAETVEEHETVLSRWHLMLHPRRARRLALLHAKTRVLQAEPSTPARPEPIRGGPLPDRAMAERLSPQARRGLCTWISRIGGNDGLAADVRSSLLDPLLADDHAAVRAAALRAVPIRGIADFCFDPEPAIARSACLLQSQVATRRATSVSAGHHRRGRSDGADDIAAWRHLTRAPAESVRVLAAHELRRVAWLATDADAVLGTEGVLGAAAARVSARRALALDPHETFDLLAAALAAPGSSRLRAITLIRQIGLQHHFADQLAQIAAAGLGVGIPDASTLQAGQEAPAALTALAESPTVAERERVAPLVTAALESPHSRFRSNALEAQVRWAVRGSSSASNGSELHDRLMDLKSEPAHRVRATALRGLMALIQLGLCRPSTSAASLDVWMEGTDAMLCDHRDGHRLAGTWLAERTLPAYALTHIPAAEVRRHRLWPALCDRIMELSSTDTSDETGVRTRARAAACRARLEAEIAGARLEVAA